MLYSQSHQRPGQSAKQYERRPQGCAHCVRVPDERCERREEVVPGRRTMLARAHVAAMYVQSRGPLGSLGLLMNVGDQGADQRRRSRHRRAGRTCASHFHVDVRSGKGCTLRMHASRQIQSCTCLQRTAGQTRRAALAQAEIVRHRKRRMFWLSPVLIVCVRRTSSLAQETCRR